MNGKLLAVIGLIGGILIAVGVFGTWMSAAGETASGWDATKPAPEGYGSKLPYIGLAGGILAVIGSLVALVKVGVIPKVLLIIGGICGLIGVSLGIAMADIFAAMPIPIEVSIGYGVYMCVVGSILAFLVTLGLKAE